MGTYYNGVNCDIYIGKGAGKKLLEDIRGAQKSIKIVSPYLSPFLISELIKFHKRDLEIELITTDTIEESDRSYEKNIHKLIIQKKETDEKAVEKREKWKDIAKILTYIDIGLLATFIGVLYLLKDLKVVFGLIPIIIIYLVIRLYKTKIENKQIYSYWYVKLFPFKVYMSPYTSGLSDTFIHGKIYVIDGQIAYLGSLNFTESGTKFNYETRVRITDPKAIEEINKEFDTLMDDPSLLERDVQFWGKQLYPEPIN